MSRSLIQKLIMGASATGVILGGLGMLLFKMGPAYSDPLMSRLLAISSTQANLISLGSALLLFSNIFLLSYMLKE